MAVVRPLVPADAGRFVALLAALEEESVFPVVSPFARVMTPAQWASFLARRDAAGICPAFVAEAGSALLGFLETERHPRRDFYELRLVVGVLAAYTGQGIGSRLMASLVTWGQQAGVSRLGLLVAANNDRALRLYRKFEFEVEEVLPHAVAGERVDEFYMVRPLGR